LWDTRRNMGTQFFTQEYEGRETDISLIPWQHDRSLTSAMFSLIKNPTPEEFQDWVAAAERETWRYIPRIKSHCAEERTLDLCVQRLRKKIMLSSWEARYSSSQQMLREASHEEPKLSHGNPSFFQSPSLVCMGGLGVLDPYETPIIDSEEKKESVVHGDPNVPVSEEHVDVSSGWGGMGLRGNHSYTNLHRSTSGGSGIFFGEDSEDEDAKPKTGNWASKIGAPHTPQEDYVKTTHMANFYYRKSTSHGNLVDDADNEAKTHDNRGRPLSASMVVGK